MQTNAITIPIVDSNVSALYRIPPYINTENDMNVRIKEMAGKENTIDNAFSPAMVFGSLNFTALSGKVPVGSWSSPLKLPLYISFISPPVLFF
jgi:hypothetical protein